MPTPAADSDGHPSQLAPPKRPWTTPRLVIYGTIPAQTFAAGSILTKQPPP
jgi:hypothetical protein